MEPHADTAPFSRVLVVVAHPDDAEYCMAGTVARWVDEGSIVTSAGMSAGIDMSLHLVRRQEGEELARATAHQMEYEWRSSP